ncbi:MmgE/PrpD family protein [Ramlibacter rhizophilus]|uniref:MmgE/PrpD family protein n=1 Tax=Ramlibacter rhizophilus TaxID=1781167 RepID=UPI001432308F|nr:MmgE/PrpD family protein [Ramlibacter rhizophilus]
MTASLGEFVAGMSARDVPGAAVDAIRGGMADTVGVAFASVGEPVLDHAASLATVGPRGQARVWTMPGFASAADAAFLNAVAGHALDFDDTGLDGHPSVVLAPVVLAEAERLGADWNAAVRAYAAGYETWAELSGRDADKHHGKGWHPTAVFGVVASAAASACLRGLDALHAAHALGIAASMAGGLVANFGSMTKPLQVGLAARNGIVAAQLAERGLTASSDALESPRGLLAALSPAGQVRRDGPATAGAPWQLLQQGLNIKRYPACYATHRIIDAALSLRDRLGGAPHEIESVTAHLGHLQAAMLRSSRPTTGLDAKFSAEYTIACALLRGHVDLPDLEDDAVNEPAVQALLRRVEVVTVSEADPEEPLFSPEDRLRVRLTNGRELEAEPVRRALGHASRPITREALREKFMACARRSLAEGEVKAWWEAATAPGTAAVRWPSG